MPGAPNEEACVAAVAVFLAAVGCGVFYAFVRVIIIISRFVVWRPKRARVRQ